MSHKPWVDRERQAIYDEVQRGLAFQYLAMVEIDTERNQRLVGCLVGLNKSRQEQFVTVCMDIVRHCDAEITGNLLPIYSMAGRLFRRYLRDGNNAKIDHLKMHLFQTLQESAYVVIDAYHNQYEALVTRSLAPELSDEERERRSRGTTRIPIDEDKLKKIRRTRHAAKDKAEKDGLRVYDKPKGQENLEAAFKASLQDDIEVTAAEEDALFKAAGELKKLSEEKGTKKTKKKPKKKSKKKKAEKGE
jgi:hypothetical protein